MSWLLKWKASPVRCQSPEMAAKIISLSPVCQGCAQPSKPPADSERALPLGLVRQEPAFPVCGTCIRLMHTEDPGEGSFHCNHQELLFSARTEVGVPSTSKLITQRLRQLMPSSWRGQVLHSRCSCKCISPVGTHTQAFAFLFFLLH